MIVNIKTKGLTRLFGDFIAVDKLNGTVNLTHPCMLTKYEYV